MVVFANRAKVSTATSGTGTITLGAALGGFQTFAAAGLVNGNVVRYVIEDGASAFEIGTGTYTASGTTLTRSVIESSNAGSAINLSGAAVVFVSVVASDLTPSIDDNGTSTAVTIGSTGIVDILGGTVKLNGATMSGVQVGIADDAVAVLTFSNRMFGMLNLTEGEDNTRFPVITVNFLGYVDFGGSPAFDSVITGSVVETNITDVLTGTTGTNGKVTIGLGGVEATLYVENRTGSSITINITLL